MIRAGETTLRAILQPMAEHLAHPATTEVVINEPGRIGVEQGGFWTWHDTPDLTLDRLEAIAVLAARLGGKEIHEAQPSCTSTLPDGQRIKMMMPPAVAPGSLGMCIRRRALDFTPTLTWLAERDYFAELNQAVDWPAYFASEVIQVRRSVVICGEIGSSKTSFAEALLRAIPLSQRIVTIEGSAEWMNLPHDNWHATYFDEADPHSAVRRVQDAMQLRPDWLPFQECRGSEAHALLRALKVGTPIITTVHAPSARHALSSLESMIGQSEHGKGMGVQGTLDQLRQYIRVVCHCTRTLPTGPGERTRYRLTEVLELGETAAGDRMVSELGLMERDDVRQWSHRLVTVGTPA